MKSLFGKPGILHQSFYFDTGGVLFQADCMDILAAIKDSSIDLFFADPPFNLNKKYGVYGTDSRTQVDYLGWCREWLSEAIRILKPGASLFLYNLPKWNIALGNFLMEKGLMFRHWIAIELNTCFPIRNRLYPSHYSLLYFSKGKPKTFKRIRTPVQTCRHCGKELCDYGGHRSKLHPDGISLKDVWTDVPPVRHRRFKSDKRQENALSTKLLQRVIGMASESNDVIVDPFGGSGTTYIVCQEMDRRWIGVEINDCQAIMDRLIGNQIADHYNADKIEQP